MFSISLITIDRTPKRNFLAATLKNLSRAGVFASPLLGNFTIVDSGSERVDFIMEAMIEANQPLILLACEQRRSPTMNAVTALRHAASGDDPWVLFLEDDIDVCARFLESVASWLKDHADPRFPVYPLGANYEVLSQLQRRGETAWEYPVTAFYGTLALAMKPEVAVALADYLEARAEEHSYDLHMGAWARENGLSHFLTPVPSFVQHIGVESFIRPGSQFHQYETWPGHDWSYP